MPDREFPWWVPPIAGTEEEHIVGALERQRATFRWKADGLDSAGLNTKIGASVLTLGGLLKHLARVEEQIFKTKLSGEPLGPPWSEHLDDEKDIWEFSSAPEDTPEELYAMYDHAVEQSRSLLKQELARGGMDQSVHAAWTGGRNINLRHLLCDLLEEYGRHTGHADLLREAVDGRVGEDPPRDWDPRPR
jgi:hypothetical protein